MTSSTSYDAVVVGGGPAGATAATDLARAGKHVLLLDKAGRIKPCGGAIPPRMIDEFAIPDSMLVAKIGGAQIVSPTDKRVPMPIEGGFVGMVDRGPFDEWLRNRANLAGAERARGTVSSIEQHPKGGSSISFTCKDTGEARMVRARAVIGADGAKSLIGRQAVPGADSLRYVFAYHEIVRSPDAHDSSFAADRCDVYYRGTVSPDFYGWVFPHGATTSVGTGSAHKGFALREACGGLRDVAGLGGAETIRREGAPIPMEPLRRWDDRRSVLLAGDAAGVVAPASGEGIYYAMTGGRLAAQAVEQFLATGDARALATARRRFMRTHGAVFWILGIMQSYWYRNDRRRERFVTICRDKDVQDLTWDAYMNKELVRARPLAHARIFWKNIAHLAGVVPA